MAMPRVVVRSNRFRDMPAVLEKRLHDVVFAAATNIVERAAESMEGQEPPSAPGHAPAIRTGLLHGSMFVREIGPTTFIAGTNIEYAPHLEFGTVGMAMRPFLLPAVELERADFIRAVKAAVSFR